jgi:hypothetical protein
VYAVSASGCDELFAQGADSESSSSGLQVEDVCASAGTAVCDAAQAVFSRAVGSWLLGTDSLYGAHAVHASAFRAPHKVDCTSGQGCTYTRTKNTMGCQEIASTRLYPATIKDSSAFASMGAAVLRGPKCKEASDWDRETEADDGLNVATFVMNNRMFEAMQFDGRLNTGLYVTDDVVASGLISKLPSNALSVEVRPGRLVCVSPRT